eukprot:TRINITY_DN3315_c0_g1_i1.p1 TRINITY_DN3315_c0_g1~~TRINITY_DN3315_c0_g1_i1.p1  ORF type:complete len:1138 (+),score=391.59 TRINITY_DN3315_c0_g1_i1:195-3608(+)
MLLSMGFEQFLVEKAFNKFPSSHQQEQRIEYILSGAAFLEEVKDTPTYNNQDDHFPQNTNMYNLLGSDDEKVEDMDLVTDLFGNSLEQSDNDQKFNFEENLERSTEEKKEEKKFLRRMLPSELQRLFVKLQHLNQRSVSTKDLTESFGWNDKNTVVQQDIHELNRVLFNTFEESLMGTSGENIVKDLYSIITSDELVCSVCNHARKVEEVLNDISISVGHKSIEESLRNFIGMEKLEGDNQWMCPKCEKKVDAFKGTRLKFLSPIVILSLLRFEFNMQTLDREKNCSEISFPFEIDFKDYVSDNNDSLLYDLFGVVIHTGSSSKFGHYKVYLKDLMKEGKYTGIEMVRDKGDIEEKVIHEGWYLFNDSDVSAVPIEEIPQKFGGKSECAYMLLYRRKDLEIETSKAPSHIENEIKEKNRELELERLNQDIQANEVKFQIYTGNQFDINEDNVPVLRRGEDNALETSLDIYIDRRKTLSELIISISSNFKEMKDNIVIQSIDLKGNLINFLFKINDTLTDPLQKIISFDIFDHSKKILVWDGSSIAGKDYSINDRKINLNVTYHKKICSQNNEKEENKSKEETVENNNCEKKNLNEKKVLHETIQFPLKIPQYITLSELKLLFQKYVGEKEEINTFRMDAEKLVELDETENNKLISVLGLYNFSRLSFESVSTSKVIEESFSYLHFKEKKEELEIFVKNNCNNEDLPPFVVFCNKSTTIYQLRMKINEIIFGENCQDIQTRLLRTSNNSSGEAFKNESSSLKDVGITNLTTVIIELGKIENQIQELKLNVVWRESSLKEKELHSQTLKFKKDQKMGEVKKMIQESFQIEFSDKVKYRLRSSDMWQEADKIITDEDLTLEKLNFKDGETLFFEEGAIPQKGDIELYFETRSLVFESVEKLWATSPFPGSHLFPKSTTSVLFLKQHIFHHYGLEKLVDNPSFLRLWSSKRILKNDNDYLKQLHIPNGSTISVEFLPEQETLSQNSIYLFVSQRNCDSRSFLQPIQFIYNKPNNKKMISSQHFLSELENFLKIERKHLYISKYSVTWKELYSSYHDNHVELSEIKEGNIVEQNKERDVVNFYLNDSDLICWKDTREDPENKDHFMRKIKSNNPQYITSFEKSSRIMPKQKEESLKIDLIFK